jgi:hypothetical protein
MELVKDAADRGLVPFDDTADFLKATLFEVKLHDLPLEWLQMLKRQSKSMLEKTILLGLFYRPLRGWEGRDR